MRLAKSIVGAAEAAAVTRVICQDGYLGMGKEVQAFEQDLAQYFNVSAQAVMAVNSGTAALHLAVQAVTIIKKTTQTPEILVPSLTFVASFQAISAAGAKPVACEVQAETATLDLHDAAKRLTANTVAIMPVHYASNPYELAKVYAFAQEHNLRVIEDAAHAFGCSYQDKKIGSQGDIICFSFDGIKNITCGEGGCIVCQDPVIAKLCQDARLLGVENDTEKRYTGGRSWEFEVHHQGYRYHMSNIMAAIGRVQLQRFAQEFAPKRKLLVQEYRNRLQNIPGLALLNSEPDADIVAHLFPLKILNNKKLQVMQACEATNIPLGQHYKPNHLLSLYSNGTSLPITELLFSQLVSLPLHPELELADLELVCTTIKQALAHA